jgi:hypothetical protein
MKLKMAYSLAKTKTSYFSSWHVFAHLLSSSSRTDFRLWPTDTYSFIYICVCVCVRVRVRMCVCTHVMRVIFKVRTICTPFLLRSLTEGFWRSRTVIRPSVTFPVFSEPLNDLELEFLLRPTDSRLVRLGIGPPFGTFDKILSFLLFFCWQLLDYSFYGVVSDEKTGLYFTAESPTGPSNYILLSHLRLRSLFVVVPQHFINNHVNHLSRQLWGALGDLLFDREKHFSCWNASPTWWKVLWTREICVSGVIYLMV